MSLLAPKPASHARGALGLYSEKVTVSSVADGTSSKLSLTTGSAHGISVGELVYVYFAATYTSGLFTALTGTTGSTLVITGTYSATTTGYAVRMLNIPLWQGVKFDHEAQDVPYNPMRDTRYTAPGAKTLHQGIFTLTMPVFLPTDATEVSALVALFDKWLKPAGYTRTTDTGLHTYRMSSDFLNYDQAFAAYEEILDREGAANCQSEFGLKFDTQSGLWFDPIELRGKDLAVASGVTALPYADIDGQENVAAFENANWRLWLYDDTEITNLVAIKGYSFKNGNQLSMREDGNSDNGVAGFVAGNMLTDQTVEFDVEAPATHTSFPYLDWFKDGTILKYRFTMFGNTTGGYGVQVNGIMQVRTKPDRSERNSLRATKVAGVTIQKATTDVPFELKVGAGLSV